MTTALAFALRNWKLIVGGLGFGLLGLLLMLAKADARHWHKRYDREVTAHQLTIVNVKAATAQARADDEAHARAVQTHDATITQETNDALQRQLADARGDLAAYARLHRPPAACGGGVGQARVPAASDPAGGADEAGRTAVVLPEADLAICAANTVKAEGWQSWWAQVSATPR